MKKNLLTGAVVALSLVLGATSCSDDSSSSSAGMGRISPSIVVDGDIITASSNPQSRANEDVVVTVSDLKLRLTSDDGSFSQEWESVDDFDETQDFKVGDYTLEAYYGDENDVEGYAKPHFHGSQDISVKYDHTTTVALSAAMKNSRVVIKYTDAFRDYMTAYSVQLHTPKGKYFSVPSDEYSPVYVYPGTVNINLSFTKPNGTGTTIEAARFDAKPKTEHVVTIDLNGGSGSASAVLKISFDDTIVAEDVEIDLSDDLLNAPAPEITPEGWTAGQTFSMIEQTLPAGHVKANILARGKIASVTLSTVSPSLRALGWPEEVDLTTAPQATIDLMERLGLKIRGLRKNPDMMGILDFTDVFQNLTVSTGLTESTHSFAIQVKDKYGKLSEVADFTVVSNLGHINLLSTTAQVGRRTINARVEYNGDRDLADVQFLMRNGYATWDELTLTSVQSVSGSNPATYDVVLTAASAIESTHTIRAVFSNTHSDLPLVVTTPEFEIEAHENNFFAQSALITIKCQDADDALVARSVKSITLNGVRHSDYEVIGSDIRLTDLTAATTYDVVVATQNHTASATIVTEVEKRLTTDDGTPINDLSDWSSQQLSNYQYLWSVLGWATLNELTLSDRIGPFNSQYAYKGTSGTIPANGRSTHSSDTSGRDGHTAGNANLHTDKQRTGSNAALIRTVGWGKNNTAKASGGSNAGFNTCDHMTPGELYLGRYSDGSAHYGIPFTSRPTGVTFWYHYDVVTPGNGDYGTAEISVYADGIEDPIATKKIPLTERNAWKKETLPLTYEKNSPKAVRLSIVFRSSENPAALEKNMTFWRTPGSTNLSGGEYVGSELYIDDVRLTYNELSE